MAIEVNVREQDKQESKYPKLMVSEEGLVVFFMDGGKGVVLVGSEKWSVGHYADNWWMSKFTDFHGSVTLSNKW